MSLVYPDRPETKIVLETSLWFFKTSFLLSRMGILIVRLRSNVQDMPRVICGIPLTLEIISMQRHKELFYLQASTGPQLASWDRFLFAQQNQPVPLLSLDRTPLSRSPQYLFICQNCSAVILTKDPDSW